MKEDRLVVYGSLQPYGQNLGVLNVILHLPFMAQILNSQQSFVLVACYEGR